MNENDIIVGLAGHIDHGKTTLIKALNGFDGDNLEEEKRRGITIDLSFSSLRFNHRCVGFIDVPGHHKLIKNMIAGIFGIDVLLLVIAANDGIMPQTLEHLYIANALNIKSCICVITKIDTLPNNERQTRLETLQNEIESLFTHLNITLFRTIPFCLKEFCKSDALIDIAKKSESALKDALEYIPKPQKHDFGVFLYYIDRVFSIKGAGCVVTGSVLSGKCEVGQTLYIYHLGKEVIVRGIESHDKSVNIAIPSHRIALNLTRISKNDLKRGFLISQKGYLRGFDTIGVGIFGTITHNSTYQCYLGSNKCSAKVQILSCIEKNHNFGNANMHLGVLKTSEPLFALFAQHLILRDDNGNICGAIVLSPIVEPIKKATYITLLSALAKCDFQSAFMLLVQIHKKGFGLISSTQRFGLNHVQSLAIAHKLKNVFVDEKALTIYPLSQIEHIKHTILDIFTRNQYALLSSQSLQGKAKWASIGLCEKAFNELLAQDKIRQNGGLYVAKNSNIEDIQSFIQNSIYERLDKEMYAPSAPYNIYDDLEIDRTSGDNALKQLVKAQKIVKITHNLFITSQHLQAIIAIMRGIISANGFIDVSTLKAKTALSRKYVIGYLEYLDRFEDIMREDQKRRFKYNNDVSKDYPNSKDKQ